MGSGVIQMGSYFGKMTPRGSGAFLNRIFGLPRPKNTKKLLKYAPAALGYCPQSILPLHVVSRESDLGQAVHGKRVIMVPTNTV